MRAAAPARAGSFTSDLSQSESDEVSKARSRLQLSNTGTRSRELFVARPELGGDKVQMYVCGVTVYDYSHIGHARVYVAFDILYRLLRHLRYDVQYVRNFTDIDDKIIARAAEKGEDALALSARFIEEFHTDMASLGCLPPTLEPKATDFIPQMVDSIQGIIANGHAYAVGGDVFFDVLSLPGYGRLSRRVQDNNRAGERVAVDPRKRSPADFALWKSAKPSEPAWPSPWGPGRPGWHIECSAMIHDLMGEVIDIHGGGQDLVFPHHENELAQSQAFMGACCSDPAHADAPLISSAAAGVAEGSGGQSSSGGRSSSSDKPHDFVRFWMHNGFVNVDSEKMSKSVGNFFTIREVLRTYHPLALRWWLVSTHYRAPVNYTLRSLEEASDRLYYIFQSLVDVEAALVDAGASLSARTCRPGTRLPDPLSRARHDSLLMPTLPGCHSSAGLQQPPREGDVAAQAVAALLDDMNTTLATSLLSAPLKAINDLMTTKSGKKQWDRLPRLDEQSRHLQDVLQLMGLWPQQGPPALLAQLRELALRRLELTEADVQDLISQRAQARIAKDFAEADRVRILLARKGILIMDSAEGTTWRPGMASQ
ncbi:MAG: hypothetical protein WDW36_005738 [Sanguina aurantia]